MLKITGICMIIAGAALFIYALYRGRRDGIRSDMKELTMILSSGYVSERVAEVRSTSPFEGRAPITPAPKKKRVLSEEARSILEMVERGRENEAAQVEAGQDLSSLEERTSKHEAPPLHEDAKKGTAVLPEDAKRGTAVLPKQEISPDERKGTAILPENAKKGTAVLPKQGSPAPERKGAAVLLENDIDRGTAVLTEAISQKKGTAVLSSAPVKKGTSVLQAHDEEKRSNDPERERQRKGTAVLTNQQAGESHSHPRPATRKGTAVLTEKTIVDEEAMPHSRKGTAVLTEKGD